jgi:DNA invertase Pin-like site-specific DNA recombinase
MIVGYARVSTAGQTLDAQRAALTAAGARKIFAEKESGAKTDRKALAKALAALGPGDVLMVNQRDGHRRYCPLENGPTRDHAGIL